MRRLAPVLLLVFAAVLSGCLSFRQGFGSIFVTTVPKQASIWLDGADTGLKAPAVVQNVWSGRHKVEVRFPGMEPAAAGVVVRRGEQAAVSLVLYPKGAAPNDPASAAVHGFVLQGRAGSPVPGATVRAYLSGTSTQVAATTTDDEGAYGLSLPPGVYDIVATKSGHAAAKRQAIEVGAGDAAIADLIARKILDESKSAVPPTLSVEYVDGGQRVPFPPGFVVTGATQVVVTVDAVYPVDLVSLRIGNRDLNADLQWVDQHIVAFNPGAVSADNIPIAALGETEMIIDAYDFQGNWVEIAIPFVRAGGGPAGVPGPVTGLNLVAITYGTDMQFFSAGELWPLEGIVAGINPLVSAKDDTSVYVVLRWDPEPMAQAYEIERAWGPAGPWHRVARVGAQIFPGGQDNPYIDASFDLRPGLEAFYRMRAIGHDGTPGPWSEIASVTPLGRFEVRLLEPAGGATNVSLSPVFRWEYNDIGADTYTFKGILIPLTQGDLDLVTWRFSVDDTTEVPFNFDGAAVEPLRPAKMYRWGIYQADAYKTYSGNSRARAVAGRNNGSVDGFLVFTTGIGF